MLSISSSGRDALPRQVLGIWALGLIVLLAACMVATGGKMVFSLDDPYIHLALSERIAQGFYGINMGEAASPSSSIAYPFLLAGLTRLGMNEWSALLLNVLPMALAVWLCVSHLARHVLPEGSVPPERRLLCGVLLCALMNAWGLPMTGLEHSIHVALTVASFCLLHRMTHGRDRSAATAYLLALCAAVLPFIRFEGLALSFMLIAALAYMRRWAPALLAALIVASGMWAWGAFMRHIGLPFLPSSVMAKSHSAAGAQGGAILTVLTGVLVNLASALTNLAGIYVLIVAWLAARFVLARHGEMRRSEMVLAAVVCGAMFGHIAAGQYGWFSRYEVYIVVLGTLYLLHIHPGMLLRPRRKTYALFALPLLTYALTTFATPIASRNIYQQQYQMHRFAVDYWKQPVAINDLGWVSYHNHEYVLDLFGLASEEARKLRAKGGESSSRLLEKMFGSLSADEARQLVNKRHVGVVMVFDDWFHIPPEWKKVAVLQTVRVTSWSPRVSFYETPNADETQLRQAMLKFKSTLPSGPEFDTLFDGTLPPDKRMNVAHAGKTL